MTSLTPKRCLTKMADNLSAMEDAQRRFAEADRDYTDGMSGSGTDRDRAIADTGYYKGLVDTYALAAMALLAGMERYPLSVKQVDGLLRQPLPEPEFPAKAWGSSVGTS